MPKHPRLQTVSSRDGRRAKGVNSPKSTSTCDLPPIQFIIHADPESLCKCCGGQDDPSRMQGLEEFCRRCCSKYQDEPQTYKNPEYLQAPERRQSSLRPQVENRSQVENYPTEDFSMQTDECQTHFHKHLYNASLLQKYCGGNIFSPAPETDDEDRSDSADELELFVEEATDATQTDEAEFPKVKLVRLLSDAETQTNESILSQIKPSQMKPSNENQYHPTMKQVNTSLTMIRSKNPFLYNFESSSIDEILQPYCQCVSAPSSRHASASPSMTQAPQQSLSNIYQLPPEEKKPKPESQTFMGCFKRKKSKEKTKHQ